MGPIELLFLVVTAIFGVIGLVRGYQRDLGVTTMLFIALFIIEFTFTEPLGTRVAAFLTGRGVTESQLVTVQALVACTILIVLTFISYQGITIVFPGSGANVFVSLLVGLLNGYLFAGSIWYYLAQADWPLGKVVPDYTALYDFLVQILPPAIFGWQFFILMAVGLLILRNLK